ncbi:lipid-A-disaccharide synthase [Leptotrichia sp. oral taxon 847]|uniref:lipid-A-disaccharide synthase n=1 Tax=Leptotrichia sp. oral taxon 847 TaxID=1785996 RepID=UPI000767E4C7|nr:lipid-A-disaccharide synthase [Leptotrichia sp. oral taxon 847]AMD94147.1 lipid-A-disaccharide synthase [Leptotrichia sp. oral taxon 847]
MEKNRKIFISCGEMSGDLHASYIVEEMKKKENLEFYGVVGDKSIAAGVKVINHIKNNDVMGFVEAIKKYWYFKEKSKEYINFIKKEKIKTVIFVDFGGFNLKFFDLVKKELPDVKTIYYIPPKVWAWGKSRIKKLKNFDEVIVIFPFEKKYFDKTIENFGINSKKSLKVQYFGNPFVDKYKFSEHLGEKILLLPGSRKQEIEKYLPVIYEVLINPKVKNEKFIMKLADKSHIKYIDEMEKKFNMNFRSLKNLEISFEKVENFRDECKFCIATSGTVTFEMALMGLPVIVVYKTSKINAFIARKIVKIKYITLTNLNAKKEIFKELLQEDFSSQKILDEMEKMEKNKEKIVQSLKLEKEKFGNCGVLKRISEYLISKIG